MRSKLGTIVASLMMVCVVGVGSAIYAQQTNTTGGTNMSEQTGTTATRRGTRRRARRHHRRHHRRHTRRANTNAS